MRYLHLYIKRDRIFSAFGAMREQYIAQISNRLRISHKAALKILKKDVWRKLRAQAPT